MVSEGVKGTVERSVRVVFLKIWSLNANHIKSEITKSVNLEDRVLKNRKKSVKKKAKNTSTILSNISGRSFRTIFRFFGVGIS